jgi:EpsI family protein
MRFWATVSLLFLSLAAYGLSLRRNPDSLAAPLDSISSSIDGWTQSGTEQLPPQTLDRLLPTSYLSRTYARDGGQLGLFIAYYAQQRAGESMHSPKHCLPGSGWEIWKYDSAIIPVDNQPTKINEYFIENSGRRMLVFYWYQSRDRIIADEYLGKVLLIRDTILAGHTAGAIVRIMVPDAPGMADKAIAFARNVVPEVQRCFNGKNPKAPESER